MFEGGAGAARFREGYPKLEFQIHFGLRRFPWMPVGLMEAFVLLFSVCLCNQCTSVLLWLWPDLWQLCNVSEFYGAVTLYFKIHLPCNWYLTCLLASVGSYPVWGLTGFVLTKLLISSSDVQGAAREKTKSRTDWLMCYRHLLLYQNGCTSWQWIFLFLHWVVNWFWTQKRRGRSVLQKCLDL